MVEGLAVLINQLIEAALIRREPHRIGVVSSYDPKTHSVKLTRQPEGIETGFIPIGTGHIGNGWGVLVGPQIGDQFVMGFVGGDPEVPFIAGRVFSDHETPPNVASGEVLLQHQSGTKVLFDKEGNFTQISSKDHTTQVGQAHSIKAGKSITLQSGAPMSFKGGGDLT